MTVTYVDIEDLVKQWLIESPTVADLVPLPNNLGPAIFLSMPTAAPNPVILCRLTSTGPAPRKDIPEQTARFGFNIVAPNRALAKQIALALIELCENTSRSTPWSDGVSTILSAQALAMRWLPDDQSDVPRYVVDALITSVT